MTRWALALPGIGFLIVAVFIVWFAKGRSLPTMPPMQLLSQAFGDGQAIPKKFTCDGEETSPPLQFKEVPMETKSLALIMDDPDAPTGTYVHWVMWNIDPHTQAVQEGEVPSGALLGVNSSGKLGYVGPCPPSGTHRYRFKLYALGKMLTLEEGSSLQDLQTEIERNNLVLAQAQLTGLYQR